VFPTNDISDQLLNKLEGDDPVNVDLGKYPEEAPQAAAIPDLLPERTEFDGIRRDYFRPDPSSSATLAHLPSASTLRAVPVAGVPDNFFQSNSSDEFAGRHPSANPHLSIATIQATLINKFNRTKAIFSLAFPTLFPYGAAKFITLRLREVGLRKYIKHLLLYRDPQFAQHSSAM
jgi:hypothetical protein